MEEKERIRRQRIEEEKRKDLMMEIDRLKSIEKAEKIVNDRVVEIKKGREVITEQIQERELKRMNEKEEQAREAQAMLRHVKQMELDDRQNKLKMQALQKRQLDEIYDANQNAIEKKQVRYQRERDEEEKIIKFNIEKAQKEAEYVAEQK